MKDPERYINNVFFQTGIRLAGLKASRLAIRRALLPLVLPPRAQRELRARVAGYFRRYFPAMNARELEQRLRAFEWHYGAKFAEDCIAINMGSVARFVAIIERYVSFPGVSHVQEALRRGSGLLVVGSHVGSPTFGTAAFLSQLLTIPTSCYPVIRLCAEPEAERYPTVLAKLETVLREYHADIKFILTRREGRRIATEMCDHLAAGALVTTNLDVLMGGDSTMEFRLFDRAVVRLPALVGAAKAALRTGAVVLPWSNVRSGGGFRVIVEEPIGPVPRLGDAVHEGHPEVLALCERLRAILERWIVDQPEQWFYWDRLHKRLVRDEGDAGR